MSAADNKDVTLSLKVLMNKEKNKVLFAEADNQFADILLSFLTLPLGTIIKVLEKKYGNKAPTIGSLSNLYHSLTNLDTAHFVTGGAKKALLNPTSSFEDEYETLELDITGSPPLQYFYCTKKAHNVFYSVSTYYDQLSYCWLCRRNSMSKQVIKTTRYEDAAFSSSGGAFTMHKSSFIITDDLQILPNETGLLGIINILGIGIKEMDKAEKVTVDLGLSEIMNLLKASLTSPTPLSDVILNKTTQMKYSSTVDSQPKIGKEVNPNSENLSLKVTIQKSTGTFLYAQANKNFIEFLFSLLSIPLGKVEHLLDGNTCFKAINSLYRSTSEFLDGEYFVTPDMKKRLMQPDLPHGCISMNHILPLTVESLPAHYTDNILEFSSAKFPKGQGRYLQGLQTYKVTDDLTVTPFCILSIISNLHERKIPISDVEEVELQIGLKEGLSILKASLSSTSVLTDALLTHAPNKRPKREL